MNLWRFYRSVYGDNAMRRERRRNPWRDLALYARNRALRPLERLLVSRHHDASQPIVFIVGAPRSGTTLLYQLVASHLPVTYVSNFVARYWMAPVVGMARYRRRFGEEPPPPALVSELGSTSGPHGPHEFGWFWQFWLDFPEHDDLDLAELEGMSWDPLLRELGALAGYCQRPLVLKSINFTSYQIAFLARRLPQSRFVHIRREPRFVVQSILESRARRYGDERHWWSTRPRDFADWLERDPIEQACHQVMDVRRAVERAIDVLDPQRAVTLEYEDLVRDPAAELGRFATLGVDSELRHREELTARGLQSANAERFDASRLAAIDTALEKL